MITPTSTTLRLFILPFLALAILSCGGGDSSGLGPTGGFSLTLTPASMSLEQGQSRTVAVTLSRTAPFTGAVTQGVFIAPPGVVCTFDPNPIPSGVTSATFTVAVAGDADPRIYSLGFSWMATGVTSQGVSLELTVTVRPGEFSLEVVPASIVVERGKIGTVEVTIARTPPWEGRVDLVVGGLPAGVTGAFAPPGMLSGMTASTLNLFVLPTAGPGAYALVIRATGPGAPERTAPLSLTVI